MIIRRTKLRDPSWHLKRTYYGLLALVLAPTLFVWAFGSVRAPVYLHSYRYAVTMVVLGESLLLLYRMLVLPPKTAGLLRTLGLWLSVGGAWKLGITTLLVGSTVTLPYGLDYADAVLAAPERWLGIRQVDARAWAEAAGLLPVLWVAYESNVFQARAGCVWWGLVAQDTRPLWEVAIAWVVTCVVGLPIALALPSLGPAIWYGWHEPDRLAIEFIPSFVSMRAGGTYELTRIYGYLGAPSYHAVMVVLLTRLWWSTPFRLASVIVNAGMLFATWVVGWHYLTDIGLGLGIAVTALGVARLLVGETAPRGALTIPRSTT